MPEFDGEIKLKSWIKKIRVNDNDDYIELNFGDGTIGTRYQEMLQNIQDIASECSKIESECKDDESDIKAINNIVEGTKKISSELENFFGEGTCLKVFGASNPFAGDVMEFLLGIGEYIEKFSGEKLDNFEKIKNKYINKSKRRSKI